MTRTILDFLAVVNAVISGGASPILIRQAWRYRPGAMRHLWILGAALITGIGLWSLHVAALLALLVPGNITYRQPPFIYTLVAATVSAILAVYVLLPNPADSRRATLGGVILGLGIDGMLLLSDRALSLDGQLLYNGWLVTLGAATGIAAALIGVQLFAATLTDPEPPGSLHPAGPLTLGFGVLLMNYLVMAGTTGIRRPALNHLHAPVNPLIILGAMATLSLMVVGAMGASVVYQRSNAYIRRVEAEAAERRNARWRTLIRNAMDIVMVLSPDGSIAYVSPAIKRLTGYLPEEVQGQVLRHYLHPDDAMRLGMGPTESLPLAPAFPMLMEFRVRHRDGRWIDAEAVGQNLLDDPAVGGVVLNIRDISLRTQAEEALRDSEVHLGHAQRMAGLGYWNMDVTTQELTCSPEMYRIFGWSPNTRTTAATFFQTAHPEDHPALLDTVKRAILTGQPFEAEHRIVLADNQVRVVFEKAEPIWDHNGQVIRIVGTTMDVTQRKQIEDEMQKAQKIESLGILAGGIAHDFNNILTVIMGHLDLCQEFLATSYWEGVRQSLDAAQIGCLQARDLSRQLLTFSKGGTPILKPASLADLFRDVTEFALRGSNVRADIAIHGTLWSVNIDAGQISQVFHNLILNATQAMPYGGVITLQAENTWVPPGSDLPVAEGAYVCIKITDHGRGIPAADLPKIFDPYFTTKPEGHGIGLTTCYTIIRQHQGYIDVQSSPGLGTTFTLYVPALPDSVAVDKLDSPGLMPGSGRLLVVDDNVQLREMLSYMLAYLGFEVQLAPNGETALELFEAAQTTMRPFDAVIIDLTIRGGMNGLEIRQALARLNPEVKTILNSGYATDAVLANYRQYGFHAFVAKPYTLNDLAITLREVLGSRS